MGVSLAIFLAGILAENHTVIRVSSMAGRMLGSPYEKVTFGILPLLAASLMEFTYCISKLSRNHPVASPAGRGRSIRNRPSQMTDCRIWRGEAPMLARMPNCVMRELADREKAFWMIRTKSPTTNTARNRNIIGNASASSALSIWNCPLGKTKCWER